jgi:hypothetical protein
VNPVDGDLYTSGNSVSSLDPMLRYHLDLAGLRATGTLVGNLTYATRQALYEQDGSRIAHAFRSMQGGAFTPWGDLFIINGYWEDGDYRGGIHLFGPDWRLVVDSTNGYGDFNFEYHTGYVKAQEPEGIDWFPNSQSSGSPHVSGELHALLLDNDADRDDDLWLKHYSVDWSCRDTVAPVVTGSPDRPANDVGWYDAPVTIDWHATDDSGTASDPPDTVAGTEGRAVSYVSEPSCDPSGNCATGSISLSIDLTDPVVQCQPATFQLHQPGASVSANVSDAQSGPVQPVVAAPVGTNAVGTGTVELTGTDHAGRRSTMSCPYSVVYNFDGFLAPVVNPPASNRTAAGQVVPIRWKLTDFNGAPVDGTANFVSVTSAGPNCPADHSGGSVESSTGSSAPRYVGDGTWQFNWQTQRAYARQCRTMWLNLADGSSHSANFEFR